MSGSQRGQDEPATIEVLVVLETPAASSPAQRAVEDAGGHVIAMYGPRVWIAQVDRARSTRLGEAPEVRSVFEGLVPVEASTELDETGRLGIAAWNARHSAEHQRAKAARPGEGLAWDHEDAEPEG
jgi:hypothetical protein